MIKINKKLKNLIEFFLKAKNIFFNFFNCGKKVIYVTGSPDWIVKTMGLSLKKTFSENKLIEFKTSENYYGYRNKVIHFGFVGSIVSDKGVKKVHKSNKIVLSWYHIAPGDEKTKFIPELDKKISFFHTICEKTKKELIEFGASEEKIKVIHSGINLNIFKPKNEAEKLAIKKKINLPLDKKIIGSFQKDGEGFGEGNNPKFVKGPDVFCDAVIELSKSCPIHVLLTGPARGYVKKRLDDAGVSYTHNYLKNYFDIVDFFHALDLYIVSSRVEGGPNAILEAWATGVPLVSTNVGMVPDMMIDGENGFMVDTDNASAIVKKSLQIFSDEKLKMKFINNGLEAVKKYSWDIISRQKFNELYKPLLK